MKLLIVINSLGTGGAEHSLAGLLPHYRSAGIEPVIVCLERRAEGVHREVLEHRFETMILEGQSRLQQLRSLRRLILTEEPQVVHTTLFTSDLLGRLAAIGTGIPVLTSLVNTSYQRARVREDPNVVQWKLLLTQLVDAVTARFLTSHFHALTTAVQDAAVENLRIARDRITIIARGRDPEVLGRRTEGRRQRVREDLGLADDARIIINVGRQDYQKGQRYLLEAMGMLSARWPRLTLLIAGRERHATAELQDVTRRLGLEDRVLFLGHREDVPDLLSAADLFVFPSIYEGLGGAVIEAMGLELPIVASDLPALREVVERDGNALLVPPCQPSALAEAIARLLEDDSMHRRFSERSRAIFEECFTIEHIAQQMIELYRAVAGKGRTEARLSTGSPLPATGDGSTEREDRARGSTLPTSRSCKAGDQVFRADSGR